MRNDLNIQVEYCEGYTVHSPPIYITRTTVTLDTYLSSVRPKYWIHYTWYMYYKYTTLLKLLLLRRINVPTTTFFTIMYAKCSGVSNSLAFSSKARDLNEVGSSCFHTNGENETLPQQGGSCG